MEILRKCLILCEDNLGPRCFSIQSDLIEPKKFKSTCFHSEIKVREGRKESMKPLLKNIEKRNLWEGQPFQSTVKIGC
jgi:hypothetical protein